MPVANNRFNVNDPVIALQPVIGADGDDREHTLAPGARGKVIAEDTFGVHVVFDTGTLYDDGHTPREIINVFDPTEQRDCLAIDKSVEEHHGSN